MRPSETLAPSGFEKGRTFALCSLAVVVLLFGGVANAGPVGGACCQPASDSCTEVTPDQCADLGPPTGDPTFFIEAPSTLPGGNPCNTQQTCCLPPKCTGDDTLCQTDADCTAGTCETDCLDRTPCECLELGGVSRSGTCTTDCCGKDTGPFVIPPPPFTSLQQLCNAFHGFPAPPNVTPPPNPVAPTVPRDNEEYMSDDLMDFLRDNTYQQLGWLQDTSLRVTGPLGGEPLSGNFINAGTHALVHIYYSPEVVGALCDSRCVPAGAGGCAPPAAVGTAICATDADCTGGEVCRRRGTCSISGDPCERQCQCGATGGICTIFPPGSMMIKEQWAFTNYQVDETFKCSSWPYATCTSHTDCPNPDDVCGQLIWLKDSCYQDVPDLWAVMAKGSDGSHDGWFWGGDFIFPGNVGNPPIVDASAVTTDDFFADLTKLTDHDPAFYPTGNGSLNADRTVKKRASVVVPEYRFGRTDCASCHASAVSESTFANLNNILGRPLRFAALDEPGVDGPCQAPSGPHGASEDAELAQYSKPLPDADSDFLSLFDQFGTTVGVPPAEAFQDRFPAQTYDHVTSTPVVSGTDGAQNTETFLTSDQCLACHDANNVLVSLQEGRLPNMSQCEALQVTCTTPADCAAAGCGSSSTCASGICTPCNQQINLSPYAEWSVSPMGLAGRDPIFFSQLEGETNNWPTPDGQLNADCIETLCLHCHGVMGQRQLALDNPGAEQCGSLLNPALFPLPVKTFETTELLTRDDLLAWPGGKCASDDFCVSSCGDPAARCTPSDGCVLNGTPCGGQDPDVLEASKYGALSRDGVSCKACHSVDSLDLGDPKTFTGNFNVGPAHEVYGPYASNTIENRPMGKFLGVRPQFGDQIRSSAMCGTCHAINLPILDSDGFVCGFEYEQATYLEWLNSEFNQPGTSQTCQECHMRSTFPVDDPLHRELEFEIANILQSPNRVCNGGTNAGNQCSTNADCPGPGGECEPGVCSGGSNAGATCASDTDCLSGGRCTTTFPPSDTSLPDDDIELRKRGGRVCAGGGSAGLACTSDTDCPGGQCEVYSRHTLYGLNVFLNEMFQQFPVLLGFRQNDFFNDTARPALITAREAVLAQARSQTADVEFVVPPILADNTLTAEVRVTNKAGHKFPSGAGFRRAFVEFLVCETESVDECSCESGALWASGCTDPLGVVVNGTSTLPSDRLASEFFCGVSDTQPPCSLAASGCVDTAGSDAQCYQPHYEVITEEDQVQIYEELVLKVHEDESCLIPGVKPDAGEFTSLFLGQAFDVKDNRLLPAAWDCNGQFAETTSPKGLAALDFNYGCEGAVITTCVGGPLDGDPCFTDVDCPSGVPGSIGNACRVQCDCLQGALPSDGSDTLLYEVQLSPEDALKVKTVKATIHYQATPPHYLESRFDDASVGPAEDTDIKRLHYISSRLNVNEPRDDANGTFIADWKLEIAGDRVDVEVQGGGAPGETPDDALVPGVQLIVDRDPFDPTILDLSWGASCAAGATDYAVYEGFLGVWYSHQSVLCSTGALLEATVLSSPGDTYYLAVPLGDIDEGGYGFDSSGLNRPPGFAACRPASAPDCP